MSAQHPPFAQWQRRKAIVAQLHLQMRPGPEVAGEGRHALDRLEGTLDSSQLSELCLLVSELLTNSVRHAGTQDWIMLDVEIYPDGVRVVVTDRGHGFEPEQTPRPHLDRPGGWGLCLV